MAGILAGRAVILEKTMVEEHDWRLLNNVDWLRGKNINPTDGEELCANAPHLGKCIFCWDAVKNNRHQFWYIPEDLSCCICEECYKDFKEDFKWKELDGWDIEWKMEDTIAKYAAKIRMSRIHYDFFNFSKVSDELKEAFLSRKYFIEKKEKTDMSLFEQEFGYKMPDEIENYLNAYWHPGIFGFYKFHECICLFAVVKYENESADDILFNGNGIIYQAKKWKAVFGGDINSYIPIGYLMSPEEAVLYDVKSGRIYLEDADNEGCPESEPFASSLKDLISHLEPVKPSYMNLKFELIGSEDSIFEKRDFEHEIKLGSGHFYHVSGDERPYLQVETDSKRLFDTAVIYYNYLLIGAFDKVYFINLWDLQVTKIDVDMYFGYFVTTPDAVYILDGTGVIAFNANLNEKWRNHTLAVDGVTFEEIIDNQIMRISCEMDPPGGWVDKKIDIQTGAAVK